MSERLARQLQTILSGPEQEIDLGAAALTVARLEYPKLNVARFVAKLDHLSASAAERLAVGAAPLQLIQALNAFLFDEEGFQGDSADYYDTRNSCLNEVMDRRRGIPITLSVVYLEIARRLSLPFFGVGLPGHFVVKYDDGDQVHFVDPFGGGTIAGRDGCRKLVAAALNGRRNLRDADFAAVEKRYVIERMLNNLRGIHLHSCQYRKAIGALDLMITLSADAADRFKERGMLYYQMRDFPRARQDLEHYLSLRPDAADAQQVEKQITGLRTLLAMMN